MNGKVVGQRYQIVRLCGAGGMGSVYEAVDSVTGARVAVKMITADIARNATLMGRFEREARAAANIDTPHIVKVLDAGTDAESALPFLVMEYLEGEDVQQLIKRLGPLPPDLALRIVAQACLGLDRAHEARIIHRDIKPANFFLARASGGQRVVKLLDFGIAKIAHDPAESNAETAGLTRTGSMLGSPLYMSPEQARGHKDLDRRADLWSMGVVLYQALTGRTPHQDTDALGELIIAICTEEAAPIQEMAPWVAPEIAAVAHGAMRFAPDERYQTAADMLDAIRPLLRDGWSIDEAMFRSLGEADRVTVQPRLVTQPDAPVGRGGRTNPGGRTTGSTATAGAVGVSITSGVSGVTNGGGIGATPFPGPSALPTDPGTPPSYTQASSLQGFGTTVGGGATLGGGAGATAPGPAQASSAARTVAIAAGAALALGLGGALAYRITRTATDAGAQPAVTAATIAATTPVTPAGGPAAAEAKPRTVKVVVIPPDATVEVDGVNVPPNDGAVEIKGAIGTVHKVHVMSPDGDVLRDVAITEEGPIPPKVAVPADAGGTRKLPGRPLSPAQPRPSSTASPLPLRNQR